MIRITIDTSNDAFQNGNRTAEVARILRHLAHQIENHHTISPRDANGNTVGRVTLTGADRHL